MKRNQFVDKTGEFVLNNKNKTSFGVSKAVLLCDTGCGL
jgi:hypothetical protein